MSKAIDKLKKVAIFTRNPEECIDIALKLAEISFVDPPTLKRAQEKDSEIIPFGYIQSGLYLEYRVFTSNFKRVASPDYKVIKYIEFIGLYLKAKKEMEAEINRGDWNPKG